MWAYVRGRGALLLDGGGERTVGRLTGQGRSSDLPAGGTRGRPLASPSPNATLLPTCATRLSLGCRGVLRSPPGMLRRSVRLPNRGRSARSFRHRRVQQTVEAPARDRWRTDAVLLGCCPCVAVSVAYCDRSPHTPLCDRGLSTPFLQPVGDNGAGLCVSRVSTRIEEPI